MNSLMPVFICGYPKSGTTLLVSLLDSHSQLLVFPEELKISQLLQQKTLTSKINFLLTETGAYVPSLGEVDFPSGKRDYTGIDGERYLQELKKILSAAGTDRDLVEAVYTTWGKYASVRDADRLKYFVEKTPGNEFLYELFLEWYPAAKFIHIVRDPRDVFTSYRKKQTRLRMARFAKDWRNSTERGLAHKNMRSYLLLSYEELVSDPQKIMEGLCAFLDINYEDILLSPTRNGTVWKGNSMFKDNEGVIHMRSKGRFGEQLTPREIKRLEEYLFDLIPAMGYELERAKMRKRSPFYERLMGAL